MKHKRTKQLSAILLCAVLLLSVPPVWAEPTDPDPGDSSRSREMTAGEVETGFAAAGSDWESSDPAVAWIDEEGSLKAMKAGRAVITSGAETYDITVKPYTDGSPVVGNLKLLVRYNDDMAFYDGHVYLLFTSYQDGVTISLKDLYGAYEISPQYYTDIRENIANGSNHTGKDADQYFTYTDSMEAMTLDRGEIVTIGMYRGFDLSVAQAALGSIQNSSGWKELGDAGKKAVARSLFSIINNQKADPQAILDQIRSAAAEVDVDYTRFLDGLIDGGVCFNRELYNQKLEWDQYENVTYDMNWTSRKTS